MKSRWVLFGFGDVLADIIDVIESNNQVLSKIVLNIEIKKENLDKYLALYGKAVEVINIEQFHPQKEELYNFAFFVPQKDRLVEKMSGLDLEFSNLIHKTATLSSFSNYGKALLVGPHVIVTACSTIGNHVRLNRAVSVSHDCVIGDYTHIGPAVTIAGFCKIGSGTFIGAGTVLKNHVTIGKNSLIGAGSVVVSDIPDNVVAFGSPAKIVRQNI